MLVATLLSLVLAAPAVAGPGPDRRELGRLWIEQSSALRWPGLYVPAFTVVQDHRRVHRLSLGLDLPGLRAVSLEMISVEPSEDPDLRAGLQGLPAVLPYGWMGVRVQIPRSQWHLDVGRSAVLATASTVARGSLGVRGGWSLNLVRPLR